MDSFIIIGTFTWKNAVLLSAILMLILIICWALTYLVFPKNDEPTAIGITLLTFFDQVRYRMRTTAYLGHHNYRWKNCENALELAKRRLVCVEETEDRWVKMWMLTDVVIYVFMEWQRLRTAAQQRKINE